MIPQVYRLNGSWMLFFRGTGDRQQILDHGVQGPGHGCLRSFIINLFSFPATDDQLCLLQLPQMVGHRGTGHLHHGRQIDDAFLTMAQDPEDPDAGTVTKLMKELRRRLKCTDLGNMLKNALRFVVVLVG